jgi:ABC-type uncharacterized transport system substrate-binding protein
LEAIPTLFAIPQSSNLPLQHSAPDQWRSCPDDGFILVTHRTKITSLAAHYRLPAVYPFRDFIEVGGLLSYGDDLYDNFRRAATYVDRILKARHLTSFPSRLR